MMSSREQQENDRQLDQLFEKAQERFDLFDILNQNKKNNAAIKEKEEANKKPVAIGSQRA